MKRCFPLLAAALLSTLLIGTADAASRRSREKVEPPPPPPPQFRVDGPTRTMSIARFNIGVPVGSVIGKFSHGCFKDAIFNAKTVPLYSDNAFRNVPYQDFMNEFVAEAAAAGYKLTSQQTGSLFDSGANAAAEINVGANVLAIEENACLDYVLGIFRGTKVEATITVDWQVFDPLEKRLLYRATNQGIANVAVKEELLTIPIDGARAAFRNAAKNILADTNFVAALRDTRAMVAAPAASAQQSGFQIAKLPLTTKDFREQVNDLRQQVVTIVTPGGTGSGFFIADGLLLTNQHVIAGYGDVKIRFYGGREISGFVISSNARRDVALIKTDSQPNLHGLPLRLDPPAETNQVYVIGSPLDQSNEGSISAGIVSGFRSEQNMSYLQSDVGVTNGNSGGPMFDDKGNVVAIVVSGKLNNGQQTFVNLFIPIADALKTLNIDPSQHPGSAPALVSLPGAAAPAPPQRDINVAMFPAAGPLRQGGQASPLAGTVSGVGGSGTFTFTRPDNVSCTGRWTTLQTKPASGSLMDKHRDALNMSQSTDGMVGGLAIGACSNNGSFEAEYYVTPGVDSGFGAASDSDGNIYKIIF